MTGRLRPFKMRVFSIWKESTFRFSGNRFFTVLRHSCAIARVSIQSNDETMQNKGEKKRLKNITGFRFVNWNNCSANYLSVSKWQCSWIRMILDKIQRFIKCYVKIYFCKAYEFHLVLLIYCFFDWNLLKNFWVFHISKDYVTW